MGSGSFLVEFALDILAVSIPPKLLVPTSRTDNRVLVAATSLRSAKLRMRADDVTWQRDVLRLIGVRNLITTPPEHRKLLCVESANCVLSQSASAKRTENLGLT